MNDKKDGNRCYNWKQSITPFNTHKYIQYKRSYLEVEAYSRPCHQVVEVLVKIPAENVLREGLVGVKRLLLETDGE